MSHFNKSYIEESFPVKEVGIEGAREKNIRKGHISSLHIWWARRPLAVSRATAYSSLIPAPKNIEDWEAKRQFIIKLCKWENSLDSQLIEKARKEILDNNNGIPPKVLDPFSGGGAIPLEALRLGCETYANDYNPVAVLIEKAVLEYPIKHGYKGISDPQGNENLKYLPEKDNVFVSDLKKWGDILINEVKEELKRFYPNDPDGSTPIAYIWARTLPCQNPSCGAEIPLMRQYWLSNKSNKVISLYPFIEKNKINFKIVGRGYEEIPKDFNPGQGTISKAIVTCPICGATINSRDTRKLFQEKKSGQRLILLVTTKKKHVGKKYRVANEEDYNIFLESEKYLKEKIGILNKKWGIVCVPDELITTPSHDIDRPPMYGMKSWGDLYNSRQKLSIICFIDSMKEMHNLILKENKDEEYTKAIMSFFGVAIDRLADKNSVLCNYIVKTEAIGYTYKRQALPMLWDYVEMNPLDNNSGWNGTLDDLYTNLSHISKIKNYATVTQSSATNLPYPDNFFDAVFTDPPYYDNIGYSNLSDFFYVWLKRSLGDLYPELFSTPLAPKTNEIVSDVNRNGGKKEAKKFFEDMLKKAFIEINRVLKPNGISTIVYAHKTTEGWESLINSLLDSGLVITGAWPINTEMHARLLAKDSAALASSIYIVARKMKREPTGFYNDVKEELKLYLTEKLDKLWEEGIGGADFFIAAIGSAIEVFGKYEKVMDYEGTIIRADRLLEDVRKIVTDYAIKKILHNGFAAEISKLTLFYVLSRWEFGEAKAPFDEARKLAQSVGFDLSQEWGKDGFILKEKEFVKILGPLERKHRNLENSKELIDVLHLTLNYWSKGKKENIVELMTKTGFAQSEAFFRVAQAISETLPNESKEKKLLEGFLSGKEKLKIDLNRGNNNKQKTIDNF